MHWIRKQKEGTKLIFKEKTVTLKNGIQAILRSPTANDSEKVLEALKTCGGETDFIMRYPEECTETIEDEEKFLIDINQSEDTVIIVCDIDGEIAGSGQLGFNQRIKTCHSARIGIGLVKKYWNLGIGTLILEEMIALAKEKGVLQLDLDFIEGNERAKALYQKVGFKIVGEKPDAVRLKDGTLLKEIFMMKKL